MRIKIYMFLLFIVVSNTISAKDRCEHNSKAGTTYIGEEEKKKDFDILQYDYVSDTLKIVLIADYSYYPLGKNKSTDEFLKSYTFFECREESISPELSKGKITMHKFSHEQSYVKLFNNGDSEYLQIVYAKIFDKEIVLSHQVKLGMGKEDFVDIFLDDVIKGKLAKVKIVLIESGITGVWQYYRFENDTLASIIIDTDYTLNKD